MPHRARRLWPFATHTSGLPGYAGDLEDIRFLVRKMNIRSLDAVEENLSRFYPAEALTPAARDIIEGFLPKDA